MSTNTDTADKYSILEISEQNFAVEIDNMKEVTPLPKITEVPNVNPSIFGVFNLRGQIHSALDLRVLLSLERKQVTEKNFIVLLENEDIQFGLIVDKVRDVTRLDSSKIQVLTRDHSTQYTQYLKGLYEHKDLGVIYILDIPAILQSKEIIRHRYL